MNFDSDSPLGQDFLVSPYEYLQAYVRNMNNQIFLSEYQINNLYVLLLIGKHSPWDYLKPNTLNTKQSIDEIVSKKVSQVKQILQSLSQVYQDKVKRNTFNQIQRLMNIIKAKNKSIYIQKNMKMCSCQNHTDSCKHTQNDLKQKIQKDVISLGKQQNQKVQSQSYQKQIIKGQNRQQNQGSQKNCVSPLNQIQIKNENENENESQQQKLNNQRLETEKLEDEQKYQKQDTGVQIHENHEHEHHHVEDQREVMGIFYGIANLPNLSTLALGNCLQYSSEQRFIKFKMSKNYIMTIKNEDQLSFDLTSRISKVPSQTFIHHIFPYLTSNQLFKVRGVCREWTQNVKQAWHSTFKREMYAQLLACQYCKQIQFYYKLIQLRNPFFQKLSLLMHALLQIIQWDKVYEQIESNTILPQLKKVLIILMKLIGQPIQLTNLNAITQEMWALYRQKALHLKQRVSAFFSDIGSACLSISQLKQIKLNLLDDPFMRLQEVNSQDKTPLLLVIFIKQLTLQQLIRNHIYFSQEYLMNTKRRLDNVSSKMPQQKGFLEGVYKILLLRTMNPFSKQEQEQKSQIPNFQQLLYSIFDNSQVSKPDFVIKNRGGCTNIFLDKATKLDIIVSTVKKMKVFQEDQPIRKVKRTYINQNSQPGRTINYEEDGSQKQINQPYDKQIYTQNQGQIRHATQNSKIQENLSQKNLIVEGEIHQDRKLTKEQQVKDFATRTQKRQKQLKAVKIYDINLKTSNSNEIGTNTELKMQQNEKVYQNYQNKQKE